MKEEKLYNLFEELIDELVPYLRNIKGKTPPLTSYWVDESGYPIFSVIENQKGKVIFTVSSKIYTLIQSSMGLSSEDLKVLFSKWAKLRFKINPTTIYLI